jgi:hypothetical protein
MEVLGRYWTLLTLAALVSRSRAAIVQRAETAQAADAKCSLAWHLCTSKQIVMCGSERFHRRFSSIDYGARVGLCACEFRGIFSGTLTMTLSPDRRALAQLRQIKCLAWFELR